MARFNELDIGWLDDIAEFVPTNNIFIYNKNNYTYRQDRFRDNYILRNIGKCDHTFLKHIVNNYANLTKYTLFLTPYYRKHLLEHIKPHVKSPLDLFQFCDKSLWHFSSDVYFSPQCKKLYYFCRDYRLTAYGGSTLKPNKNNLTFGEWMIKYIEPKFDDLVRRDGAYVNFGGTFCYSRKNIMSRTLQFYKELMKQFDTNDSEVAHYFERAWHYIFNAHINKQENI